VGHCFSWRPVRAATRSRVTTDERLSVPHVAGRPDDPILPRYVLRLDLTNVALVSCGVSQAQTWERIGTAIETHVKMLLFEMFPSLYNTPHTTPHDLKRGAGSLTAIPQSTRSSLSTFYVPGTTSSVFSSASSRCLDLLMTFREGRARVPLPSNPRVNGAQHGLSGKIRSRSTSCARRCRAGCGG